MPRSRFEQSAQQAAVEAVERRWQRKHDIERKARLKARLRGCFSALILLAGLIGIVSFVLREYGVDLSKYGIDMSVLKIDGLSEFLPDSWSKGKMSATEIEINDRNAFVAKVMSFEGKNCRLWKDLPTEMRPKVAPEGTRYLILGGNANDVCLFDVSANGQGGLSFVLVSPVEPPRQVSVHDFQTKVGVHPSFVLCRDEVYLRGFEDVEIGRRELSLMLDAALGRGKDVD
mgnify:CR=1 FL=1